jgi:hypothetical protein
MHLHIRRFWLVLLTWLGLLPIDIAAAQNMTFRFNFWPSAGVEKDPRFLARHEGACGDVVEAAVLSMPNPRKGDAFGTDIAFELSAQNRIINTWHLPVNALPVATAGKELVFTYNSEHFAVTSQGRIRRMTSLPTLFEPREVNCKLPPQLKGSGYARCAAFPQLGTTSQSVLAYQGPCT